MAYRPNRQVVGESTKHVEEHKNFLFFVLYYLRRGDTSFKHLAFLFGFDKSQAVAWYVSWLCALCCCLARLFPQPNMDLIRLTSPPKWLKMYRGRMAGIIDCTEMRMQTPFDKMVQRATYSEYKSNNTIKYLVVISPTGATVYVSPGFPGRISDPQICQACATFGGYDAQDESELHIMEYDLDLENDME